MEVYDRKLRPGIGENSINCAKIQCKLTFGLGTRNTPVKMMIEILKNKLWKDILSPKCCLISQRMKT